MVGLVVDLAVAGWVGCLDLVFGFGLGVWSLMSGV